MLLLKFSVKAALWPEPVLLRSGPPAFPHPMPGVLGRAPAGAASSAQRPVPDIARPAPAQHPVQRVAAEPQQARGLPNQSPVCRFGASSGSLGPCWGVGKEPAESSFGLHCAF